MQFLWLPLAHSFGKVLQVLQLKIGFPTAVDGRVDQIVDNLPDVRPTLMGAPPRIFEKVYAKVVAGVEEEGGLEADASSAGPCDVGQSCRRAEAGRASPCRSR